MTDPTPPAGGGAPPEPSRSLLPGMEQGVRRLVLVAMAIAIAATALPVLILAWGYQEAILDHREEAVAQLVEQNINAEVIRLVDETEQVAAAPVVATTLTDTAGRHVYLASVLDQHAMANQSQILLRDYRGRVVAAFPESEAARITQAEQAGGEPPGLPPSATRVELQGNTVHIAAPVVLEASQRVIGAVEFRIHLSRLVSANLGTMSVRHAITIRHQGMDIYGPPATSDQRNHPIAVRLPGDGRATMPMQVALLSDHDETGDFLRAALAAIALAGVLAFIVALAIARRMARNFAAPLAALVAASRRFQRGEPSAEEAHGGPRFREFAILSEAIAMAFRAREEETRRARFAAEHDSLTELHNRVAFDQQAEVMLAAAAASGTLAAVLYMDLDRFKPVNDRHGHDAGDKVLKVVAGRLSNAVRGHDLVSRRGGDEFTLILRAIPGPEIAERIGHKIIAAIEAPIVIGPDVRVEVGASIGIAIYPLDGTDLPTLIAAADAALAEVKGSGRGRCLWAGKRASAG